MSTNQFRKLIAQRQAHRVRLQKISRMRDQQTMHLDMLYQLGAQLPDLHEAEYLPQRIIELLERTLGYDYGAILLVDQPSRKLVPIALSAQGHDQTFIEVDKAYVAGCNPMVGIGITGWVAQTGQSARIADVRQDRRYYAIRDDIQAELCVPLRVGQEVLGVINTETTRYNSYTRADQQLLETVANHLAYVIHYHQLVQQGMAANNAQSNIASDTSEMKGDWSWHELGAAFAATRQLQGLLVICAQCKRVRDMNGTWQPIAKYFDQHPQIQFSHGLCPNCLAQLYPEYT